MGRPIKKKRKKCSTLSAVKKRKKKTLASDKVSKLWTCETPVACDWRVYGNGNRVARMLNTHERERETHVMSTGSWLKPVVCACHCFIECRETACPVAPAGKGNIYIKEPKKIDSLFFIFLGPRKRMRLLSVLNYLAFEIFAYPPLCCICLLIQASSSYPPPPSPTLSCVFSWGHSI